MKALNPWMLAPGLALAGGAVFVSSGSPDPRRLVIAALAGLGVLIAWGAAMAVRRRHPERPLWIALCAMAVLYAMQPLTTSDDPLLFTLARAARPALEVLLVSVMLSFPTGRLTGWRERAIVISMALAVLLLWLPGLMFSPRIPLPTPFVTCGHSCPENLLYVSDRPAWADVFLGGFRVVGTLILLATSAHLFRRLRHASSLMRRALWPVLVASIARTLYIAAFLVTGIGLVALLSPRSIAPLILANLSFYAVPLSIVWGLLRGRLYTARALERLVTGLRRRQGPAELRIVMAEALDDPKLQIGYWDDANSRWVDADRREVLLPTRRDLDEVVRVLHQNDDQSGGRPMAVLVHDRMLLEEPLLLDAVLSSMQAALFSHQAELAMAGQHAEAASAVEYERRRIERDLHDGAQQRLLALRMKLGVSVRLLDDDPGRAGALLKEMDADIAAAVAELRATAQGIVPPVLAEAGLAAALADAAAHAAIDVALELQDVGRVDPAVERAVYFCCLEALQNAAKHAGPTATARVRLKRNGDLIAFSVEDNGCAARQDPELRGGQGLRNIRERLLAVGGQVEIEATAAGGLRLRGSAPGRAAAGITQRST